MKKVILIFLCAAMLLTGCASGSSYTKYSVESTTEDSWTMSYEEFNGVKTMNAPAVEGKKMVFAVEIITESGALGLTVTGANGTQYYTGNELPTSSFSVEAGQSGPYTISVEADHHCGSFSISWSDAE